MIKRDYDVSVTITKNMIDEAVKRLKEAVDMEHWGWAIEQQSYLSGLRQALFNFGVTYYEEGE